MMAKGITIIGRYNTSLPHKLQEAIKRCGILTKDVHLLEDNTPVRNSHSARMEAQSNDYDLLSHPLFSPDLAPSDSLLSTHEVISKLLTSHVTSYHSCDKLRSHFPGILER